MTLAALGLLWLVFLSAFGLTKLLCSPAPRLALLDHPNPRSLHTEPIPRTGGLAIFGSVILGLVLSLVLEWPGGQATGTGLWILGVTLIVGAVSMLIVAFLGRVISSGAIICTSIRSTRSATPPPWPARRFATACSSP